MTSIQGVFLILKYPFFNKYFEVSDVYKSKISNSLILSNLKVLSASLL